ncbi:serine hydrolase [Sphingobium sp. AN558]|uniref:serine hydrolase n=1 Tax=Sphingobium sp. AN558 TaxID=3133442 RepID=UPI0030BE04E0
MSSQITPPTCSPAKAGVQGARSPTRPWPPAFAGALLAIWLALFSLPAFAQPTPAYHSRAQQLVRILSAPGQEADFFSDLFLKAVPTEQWRAVAADLRQQNGKPLALGAVRQDGATAGQVEIRYEHATIGFILVVAPAAPNRVIGLRIVGVARANDSMDKVMAELAALPGHTAFAAAKLTDAGPQLLHARAPDAQMATGSSFKLYILAEAARAVAAGDRHWSDVLPLAHKSFSGRLMTYPDNAPMTLHSLAAAMIAESDNSAADSLLWALDRDKVDAVLAETDHASPDKALPLLTTAEAFALKMPVNAPLRARYAEASPAARRALLGDNAARLAPSAIDIGSIAETPTAIDQIEWFASPMDEIRLLDHLRRQDGEALAILAINPGIAPADAKRWAYLGYKGGSEPGVIAMNALARAKDGGYYAVSGIWNDPAARVDDAKFVALMTRALNLLSE